MSEQLRADKYFDWDSLVQTPTIPFVDFPKSKSILLVNGQSVQFNFTDKKPCLWWRIWQWLLMGWKWEDYNG